jgi:ferritin-like metal-binding protein YciE
MDIQKAQDLFVHMLGVQYNSDQKVSRFLTEAAKEAEDPQVKSVVEQLATAKQQMVQNDEKAFKAIGMQPTAAESKLADRLIDEHKQNLSEIRRPEFKALYVLWSVRTAMGIHHARYSMLTRMARLSGNQQLFQPLDENYKMEQNVVNKWDQAADQIAQRVFGGGAGTWQQPYAGGPTS